MKKITKYIFIFILCLLFATNGVKAKSYIKDLFQTDENLEIKNDLNGTAFLMGNKVSIESNIEGIGFVAGETVNISGNQEYLVLAGMTNNIDGNIKNDAFIFGQDTNIKGNIERDLYIYTNSLTIEGNINRNSYVYAASVDIKGNINGNITINALEINIDEDSVINGTLKYNKDAVIKGLTNSIDSKTYEIQTTKLTFKDYITTFINEYIHITLLAIVLVFVVERLFKKSLEQTKELNTKTIAILCGKGFLILIGVPIIAMMLLLSGALVSVGILGGILYGILIYVSNIFTAYFLSNILDKKYFKKKMNSYVLMIIGLLIIKIVSIIPILGPLASLVSMLLGLGITGNMLIELKK